MLKQKEIDVTSLERILERTITTIEASKKQIFELAEDARTEKENILKKLSMINDQIGVIIGEVDSVEGRYNSSRKWLVNVSKNFKTYAESDIQKAYEEANKLQLDLFILREKELNLKNQRHDLQLRLKNIETTIVRAEMLITQVSVVADYLANDISKMSEVMESAKFRQMFGLKIIQAQEEERKRVARDIHDGPAQSMANVVLRTEIAERLLNNNQIDTAIKELKDLKAMVRDSLADVRQIIFDLRPMALDDLGLLPTLRKYTQEVAKRENLRIDLKFIGKEKRLSSSMEVAIFRLIQEILNNVVKHAKATLVQAIVEYTDQFIKVVIQDNGVGFIEEEVLKSNNSFGLMGMNERIQLLEGEFDIHSVKSNGTTVIFKIPINEGGEAIDESAK